MDNRLLPPVAEDIEATTDSHPYFSGRFYWYALILLVLLTVADNVLVVVLFDTFGERYAQYLNQGTAFVYIVWSSLILLYRRCTATTATTATTTSVAGNESGKGKAPHWVLIGIGLFNGTGNFCMAIAQPHTPGITQTLLNLAGIPLVLLLSTIVLRKKSTAMEWFGAVLIVIGVCVSGLRPTSAGAPIVAYVGSVLFYASAQLFLSGEKIWEEFSFASYKQLDPMIMFWYTLVTQFILGWFLYPLQTIPMFGNLTLSSIPSVISGGVACTFGDSSGGTACSLNDTLIFFGYCSVDFWCYFFGLWVIQQGGANLMVITIALALPLQQLVLCSTLLVGKWAENFFEGDAVALVLVLLGFGLYQYKQILLIGASGGENSGGGGGGGYGSNTTSSSKKRSRYSRAEAKEKAAEAHAVLDASRQRRRSSRPSVVRSVLACDVCEGLERGMCDNCRLLFTSDEWLRLHPEWKAKREKEKEKSVE